MKVPAHPSNYITPPNVAILRSYAGEAELLGTLCPQQLQAIYHQNWFNLFVPKALGGLELPLPEALALQEAIAWADGSAGWVVTLCSGANWFAGFMNPDTAADLYRDKKVCMAGSGRPTGTAKNTPNGYVITGQWQYATGAPHATAFTANCIVEKEGSPMADSGGNPVFRSFVFLRDEVDVQPDWHTTGMVATASHRFTVNSVYVANNRCFTIDAQHAVLPQPIYQYPFLQFAQATLSINTAGMAVRFVELAEVLFTARSQQKDLAQESAQLFFTRLASAKQKIAEARNVFFTAVQHSWQACAAKQPITPEMLHAVSNASNELASTALAVSDSLYPFCGLAAAEKGTEINRVWRNLHTASQHILLMPA